MVTKDCSGPQSLKCVEYTSRILHVMVRNAHTASGSIHFRRPLPLPSTSALLMAPGQCFTEGTTYVNMYELSNHCANQKTCEAAGGSHHPGCPHAPSCLPFHLQSGAFIPMDTKLLEVKAKHFARSLTHSLNRGP